VDLDDLDRMTLIGGLKAMGRGKYTVRWTAVSADDRDMAKGTFSFTVR
jgi:methionine-rich copper-binding protein CopC